jgi:phage shock protein PspC (stress-responsive transcriptional regulator)
MNKTVNINIGGLFFHIDENAYQKLSRYFDAIKRSLSNSSGKDEIMKDIEMRVAELLTEKQKSDKHVINNKDVDEVVTVMGQPEDYRIDDDSSDTNSAENFANPKRKKLYRDTDRGLIGGVCTGLGHYFGIDAVWLKLLFLIFALAGFGTGIVAYFVLWIAMPEAKTTTEKLEMTGEPVTISNIEKKVREEFENVSNKFKNVDYDKMGNQIKSTSENVGSKIGDIFVSVFGVFAKVLGAVMVVFSSVSLLGICIASIVLMFSSTMPDNFILNNINTPISLETPLWIQGILFLFAFGIPFFFLLILGLKLLVTNLKSIGNVIKYSLLAIWIIAIGIVISLGIKEATQIAYEGKVVQKEVININPNDTLYLKFKNNDFYSKNVNDRDDFRLVQDNNIDVLYSNDVSIEVMPTDEKLPYIQVEKLSLGKSSTDAKNKAQKIKYNFKIVGNQIILDNYFLSDLSGKFKDQSIELYLYLPKGTILKPDNSVENFDRSDDEFFNLHYSSEDYIYKVGNSQVKCLNCPDYENEYNDVDSEEINVTNENDSTNTVSVKINGVEVTNNKIGKPGKLVKDENGVIIKTK